MQGNKLLVTLLMIIVIIGLFTPLAAQSREVQLSGNPSNVRLQNNSDYGFELRFTVDKLHLQSLDTKGGTFDEISIDGFGHTGRIGEAKLPVSSRIVAVPLGAEVRFEILASESVNLSQRDSGLSNQIIPAQASVSKSADYATLPFEKSSVYYASDQLSKNPSFRIEEIGVLRGVRLFQFYFEPVKYNPVSGDLQIITTADIKVDFINPDLVATENLLAKTASWEFEQLYAKSIFNWNHDTRTSLVRNPTKMVILCPSAYSSTMAPYIEWKRKEGLIVNLVTVGTGGTVNNSTTAIKSYMQGLWNSATTQDPAPTYLIIVGDHGTTGNNITANTGSAGSHVTDLNYVRLNGTDYLPEMYFGRFSVSSSTELTNVINKTLMFAQTSMPDLSYLGKTVLIAGVDASWAPTHGNGAINYATEHYFNTAHGITSNNYPYPQSGSSDAQIVANAAEGRGYLNYTAHGSQTAWHDPNFTSTQMMNLTNTNKPFVAVGNCCITNEFDYSSPCFGEAIIRSNNAGAAYIGGTNSTYWDEDFYWAVGYKTPQTTAHPYDPTKLGAYDAMFHAPTNVADWAQTMGETMFMGNMAVQASTSSRKNYYWEIYSIMGDPSLMPYYGVPTVNTATFPAGIMLGLDSMNITAEAYSRVALSMNGTLYASEIVPASGSLTLNFTPFTTVGTADLVITRSGKITRQETIQVLPASGPYMTVETNVYADSNNNQPDYNESGRFNTTFKNVGANSVSNVTATLSCATAGITITDATESIASLAAGASITRNNAFAFSIANNVADGTLAAFTITMVSGTNSWTHEFSLELNAPVLSFGNITISDPSGNNNGRLDPGETVTISIPILNEGGAASLSGSATLSCNTTGITVNTGTANFSAIAANSSRNVSFSLSASASMSLGSIANLVFNASAGSYSATKNEAVAVGLVLEDFETGNFNSYPWIMEGTLPWTISSVGAYQGTYTAKSGAITNSQSSTMKTSRILSSPGTLRFRYKVSSESGYDFLKFYVDGIQQGSWSGEVDWTEATYELAAGIRELSWSYTKDGSVLDGSDCAWVDYIVFPASTSPSSFFPPRDLTASVGNGIVNLNWLAPVTGTPSSYRIYKNGSLLTDVTTLSYTDTAVVNETTYSYYVTTIYSDPAGESEPSNTVQAMPTAIVPTEVIIGTGTASTGTSTASPINIWYKSLHGQSVYTAAELNAAGIVGASTLNEIGFNITGLPAYAMPNFMIRIGHTDASDASSWIETGLTTVYSNTSYLPAAQGWNMYSLSTPFEWNGEDNIVVDTAFGLLENYSSSGTVQYSEVTSGYRYNRNDSSDQTNNFSDGSTSTYRPNLKIAFNPIASDEARIYVNPASLEFEEVNLGSSESQTLRISNSGDIPLTGTVTTPTGFSISQRRAGLSTKAERNTISISIPARENRDYQVVFSPTTATAYSGNIVISSNATNNPSLNVPVSGFGYLAPTIGISAVEVSASLSIGETGTDSFTITNTGGETLTYSISLASSRTQLTDRSAKNRNIEGSTLSINPGSYTPGTTSDFEISVTNTSPDTEWLEEVILTLPAGITVNSASAMTCSSGSMDATIDGSTITWFGENSSGYGIIHGSETGTATISVNIPASTAGDLALNYTLNGDVWGDEPHSLSSSVTLTQDAPPVEWLSISPLSGSLNGGQSHQITASFSAAGMSEGTYYAMITISSNDSSHPTSQVEATLEVSDQSNHTPVINLPESFSFEKNGNLQIDLSSYASDPDDDLLNVMIVGNANVEYDINNMLVTLTAVENWVGTETLTFIISDGELSASDQADVIVMPVNEPEWVPVSYPNNPATIYATVNIDGFPATTGDWVGAFVGEECRGTANIVVGRLNAYATIVVQLSDSNETVYFKVYSYEYDTIYDANVFVQPEFGEEIGEDTPLEIEAEILSSLNKPIVSIQRQDSALVLNWEPVLHADYYEIFYGETPDGSFNSLGITTNTTYSVSASHTKAFFRIQAFKGTPAK